jgi:hypothetical protein
MYNFPVYNAMNTYGNGGIYPRILNLNTRWKFVFSFMHQALLPWENIPKDLLDKRLCDSQRRCRCCGEVKNLLSLQGSEPQFLSNEACSIVDTYPSMALQPFAGP